MLSALKPVTMGSSLRKFLNLCSTNLLRACTVPKNQEIDQCGERQPTFEEQTQIDAIKKQGQWFEWGQRGVDVWSKDRKVGK